VDQILVSVDMEGVGGVTAARQVRKGTPDYPAARELMIEEANAAIRGAMDGGAEHVVVNDSHEDMTNLVVAAIDERATVITGYPKSPGDMIAGLTSEFDGVLFIGYHASSGTQQAVLAHTLSDLTLRAVRVNGEEWGETEINAARAGYLGVPVLLVSGDDKVCARARQVLPMTATVEVKRSLGVRSAASLPVGRARELIYEGARRAVSEARAESFRPMPPFVVEAELATTASTEFCEIVPGTTRIGIRSVQCETEDFEVAYQYLIAWLEIGLRGLDGDL
jgi:D-amino peptidase